MLAVNPAGIPAALVALRQWVVWRLEERHGKQTKVPYCPATGEHASTTDPTTWTVFEAAEVCARTRGYDGVGFVFTADDPYAGIDLDGCIDPETGEIAPWAAEYLELLPTYTERSVQGRGLHLIVEGSLPGPGRKKGAVEMYSERRYFVMTGEQTAGESGEIARIGLPLKLAYEHAFPPDPSPPPAPPRRPPPLNGTYPADSAVVEKVIKDAHYAALWRGDTGGYPSHSEADLALCGRIAFFAGPDPVAIDRIFKSSGLEREKWDDPQHGGAGSTYGADTIARALAGKSAFYDWDRRAVARARAGTPSPARGNPSSDETVNGASEGWEEPVSLDVAVLPAFPIDALPPYLGAMVTGTAHATQTPPDLAAMVSLAVLSAAAQKRAEALVREGWREVLSLWTVTSLAPGNRKTHAYGPIVQPLIEYEIELVEQMKDEIAAARTEYEITEGALKKLKDAAVKAKNSFDREEGTREAIALAQKLERMPVPKSPRLIADDATPEELGRLLVANGGRMAIVSDEGDVFDMMAGKYSSGKANIGVYLRGHSGGDVIVDRVGRTDVVVRRAAIAFGLCVQPETLTGLTSNPTFKGRGLVGRFLYAMPSSRLGDREIRPAPLLGSVAAVYHAQMKRLLSLPAALDASGNPTPHLIPFSEAAEAAVEEWEREIEPRLRPGADLGHMTDWAGKLVGQTCRIAALLHLAELAEIAEPWRFAVELDTFLAARRIAEYLIPHALCAFQSMGSDPVFTKARLILAWIKRAGQPQFAKRDAFNALRAQFPRAAELDEPLVALLEHGFLRQAVPEKREGPGQPPSPSFLVYPGILER